MMMLSNQDSNQKVSGHCNFIFFFLIQITKKSVLPFPFSEGSALEFVKKLRQKTINEPKADIMSPKTREKLVSEIGISMNRRISQVVPKRSLEDNKSKYY